MPTSTPHIIKRNQVSASSDEAAPDSPPGDDATDTASLAAGLHKRIASERVRMKKAGNADPASDPPGRILRGAQVANNVQTVEIPTLELTADFPLPEDQQPEPPPEPAPPSEDEMLREEIEREWKARMEEAVQAAREEGREQGRAEGYDEGYTAAKNELQSSFQERVATLTSDADRLSELWNDYIETSQPYLLQLMIDVAEALLDAPLPDSVRGASARAIAEAVEDLAGDPPLSIRLHPVDYQRLQETGMIEQLNANHDRLQWNTHSELDEGDWSVESPVSMIRHFKDELIRTLRTRIGSLQDTPTDASAPPSANRPE